MNSTDSINISLPTFEHYMGLVEKWGVEHGITNEFSQFAKMIEEVGELSHELCRHHCGKDIVPSAETLDAVGDVLVTLIIFCDIIGVDPKGCLALAYEAISDRKGKTIDGCFVKEEQ